MRRKEIRDMIDLQQATKEPTVNLTKAQQEALVSLYENPMASVNGNVKKSLKKKGLFTDLMRNQVTSLGKKIAERL